MNTVDTESRAEEIDSTTRSVTPKSRFRPAAFVGLCLISALIGGLIGRARSIRNHRDEAIAEIRQLGGSVYRNPSLLWLRKLIGDELVDRLRIDGRVRAAELDYPILGVYTGPGIFVRRRLTDDDMRRLLPLLTSLRELSLHGNAITDAGLVHLKGLTNLKSLDLSFTPVTGKGLKHLEGLTNLEVLDLRCTKVQSGLASLKHLPKLRILWLGKNAGMLTTKGSLAYELWNFGTPDVPDEEIEELMQSLPDLKVLR